MQYRLGVCAAVLLIAAPAHADVVFDGGMPSASTGGGLSDVDADARQGDDFVLTAGASTIDGFRWYGFYNLVPPETDNFSIWIYETTGGTPNMSPAFTFAVGAVTRTQGSDYYIYEVGIAPLGLTAGQSYVLSVFNSSTPGFDDDWSWYTSGEGAGFMWLGGDLLTNSRDFAFQLLGPPIPSPAGAIAFLGVGLFGTLQRRRVSRTNLG